MPATGISRTASRAAAARKSNLAQRLTPTPYLSIIIFRPKTTIIKTRRIRPLQLRRYQPASEPGSSRPEEPPGAAPDPYTLFEQLRRMAEAGDSPMRRWQRGSDPWGENANDAWFARVRMFASSASLLSVDDGRWFVDSSGPAPCAAVRFCDWRRLHVVRGAVHLLDLALSTQYKFHQPLSSPSRMT